MSKKNISTKQIIRIDDSSDVKVNDLYNQSVPSKDPSHDKPTFNKNNIKWDQISKLAARSDLAEALDLLILKGKSIVDKATLLRGHWSASVKERNANIISQKEFEEDLRELRGDLLQLISGYKG